MVPRSKKRFTEVVSGDWAMTVDLGNSWLDSGGVDRTLLIDKAVLDGMRLEVVRYTYVSWA